MFKSTEKDLPEPYNRLFGEKEDKKDVTEKTKKTQNISLLICIVFALMLKGKDDSLGGYYY